MGLDIRLPIGLMFSVIGALLAIFGVAAPDKSRSLGLNVNLVWGLCILGFGVVMLLAWRFVRKPPAPRHPEAAEPPEQRRGGHS